MIYIHPEPRQGRQRASFAPDGARGLWLSNDPALTDGATILPGPDGPDDNTSRRIRGLDSSAVEYTWEVDSEIYTIAFQQSLEICV